MLRRAVLVMVAACSFARPAAAQSEASGGAIMGTALGIGYLVLSGASIYRLTQGGDAVAVGAIVRFRSRGPSDLGEIKGRLTATDADSITVLVDDAPRRFARTDVRDMSGFVGMERKWAQGWAAGFVTLGTVGAVAGLASGDDPPSDWFSFTAPQKGVILGIVGAITGSTLGALIGGTIEGERWRIVDRLPSGVTAVAGPSRGGFMLGARVPF
jgi:hypothetical protein